jgi:hypothetical protein
LCGHAGRLTDKNGGFRPRRAVEEIDTDGSGRLDQAELVELARRMGFGAKVDGSRMPRLKNPY